MEIYAIDEGIVESYLLDPRLETKLPVIPNEMNSVNFTWKSGDKKYYYDFFLLKSYDESILKTPSINIKKQGRVPKRHKGKDVWQKNKLKLFCLKDALSACGKFCNSFYMETCDKSECRLKIIYSAI